MAREKYEISLKMLNECHAVGEEVMLKRKKKEIFINVMDQKKKRRRN